MIRNGLNIPISEVDGMVAALPGVAQCAGYGVADDADRRAAGDGRAPATRRRRSRSTRWSTAWWPPGAAKWKIPEELVIWDEPFPETASGKVQRNLLEERGAGLAPRTARAPPPLTPAHDVSAAYQRITNSRGVLDLVDALGDHLGASGRVR